MTDWKDLVIGALALPLAVIVLRWLREMLRRNITQVLDAMAWLITRLVTDSLVIRMSLARYCRTSKERDDIQFLQVPGVEPTSLPVWSIFVPLRLESGDRKRFEGDDLWRNGATRVQVVGDPGSGKSSLAKRLFWDACEQAGEDKGPLPIFLELKYLEPPSAVTGSKALADWMLQALRDEVGSVRGYQMNKLFDAYLDGRGLLVLLDGLDEVPGSRSPDVFQAIVALSRQLAKEGHRHRILLTMRSEFHRQVRGELDEHFGRTLSVQPFTAGDIYQFLVNRFVDDQAMINRIYATLSDRPTLREMCSNPLVLAMYVVNYERSAATRTADTRTDFYASVVEEFLIARRSRQLGFSAKKSLRLQREALLGRLALENLLDPNQPANVVPWGTAVRGILDVFGPMSREDAEQRLHEICVDTGIVGEERPGESLRFSHLTFCEFFAAKEAAQGNRTGWQQLIERHRQFSANNYTATRLIEVLPFATGLMVRAEIPEALGAVWQLGDLQVMGRCFLETQAYDQPAWREYVRQESEYLRGVGVECWDEVWIRRLHLFNVVLSDEAEWQQDHGRQPTLRLDTLFAELVGLDRARLASVFGSYATHDAQAAFRLAVACGVDMVTDLPNIIINGLIESEALLAIVIQRFTEETIQRESLALVLAEAALRTDRVVVSQRLAGTRLEPEESQRGSNGNPWHRRWFTAGPASNWWLQPLSLSLLTYVLTLVTEPARNVDQARFPAVAALRNVRPPGSLRFRAFMWCYMESVALRRVMLATLLCSSALTGWLLRVTSRNWIALLLPATVAALYAAAIPARRAALYRSLMNLSPDWVRPTVFNWVDRMLTPGLAAARLLSRDVVAADLMIAQYRTEGIPNMRRSSTPSDGRPGYPDRSRVGRAD